MPDFTSPFSIAARTTPCYRRQLVALRPGSDARRSAIDLQGADEYNANWRADGLGDSAPIDATRFSGILASFVNFDFDVHSTDPADGLLPGESSCSMFLDTTATNFAKTAKFDLTDMAQNPISEQFAAYSPVPVPPAVWMFGSGLLGLIGISRRTRSA